ncbi:Bifunctional protein Aas [Posidoniimonas polymericola]|uniref:Bifunctional protein Aas n=1 Tax=Posidoniimonas polymericola TaxID=2528002 RepID=A0A5C5YQN0_9BACT|nr:AMP-binding protein [Posidoniimonas polymericola]TWT77060.1 Bifunctional protein Aas [Posidoniimonas polymericola]
MIPPRAMIRACRRASSRWKIADSTGSQLTGSEVLLRSLVLRRMLRREVLANDELYVGVLLPPSLGGAVVNAALALDRRVTANLNYSATSAVMNKCIKKAGIRHVLTSEKLLSKLDLDLDAEVVCLEDLKDKATAADKLLAAVATYATPAGLLDKMLGLDRASEDDEQTVLFTSGSTGDPKGVVLTYRNVATNVYGMGKAIHLTERDVLLGILPFFHAFGYTVTLWGPLMLDVNAAYHVNPLEARQVGKLAATRGATILLSTPTFLRSYLKRCSVEDFKSLEIVVVGAEKLPQELSDKFEAKFGVRPIEGYGATELSPLVSVNIPPTRAMSDEDGWVEGSVGKPLPEVEAKIVHPETFEPLPPGEDGMLLITGPNLMKGYFNDDAKTSEAVRDGWYVTGDIARLDERGFIHITGRQSRFSKIGGEMVPHVTVEEAIQEFVATDDDESVLAVVSAVPDAKKGERLVVLHLPMAKTPNEVRTHLTQQGLPNLWIPSADSFVPVEELPLLGSGKLDLKKLAQLALELSPPRD